MARNSYIINKRFVSKATYEEHIANGGDPDPGTERRIAAALANPTDTTGPNPTGLAALGVRAADDIADDGTGLESGGGEGEEGEGGSVGEATKTRSGGNQTRRRPGRPKGSGAGNAKNTRTPAKAETERPKLFNFSEIDGGATPTPSAVSVKTGTLSKPVEDFLALCLTGIASVHASAKPLIRHPAVRNEKILQDLWRMTEEEVRPVAKALSGLYADAPAKVQARIEKVVKPLMPIAAAWPLIQERVNTERKIFAAIKEWNKNAGFADDGTPLPVRPVPSPNVGGAVHGPGSESNCGENGNGSGGGSPLPDSPIDSIEDLR
jgi:hypothetical protein